MLLKTDICVYYDYGDDTSVWVRYPFKEDVSHYRAAFLLCSKIHRTENYYHCEPVVEFPTAELVKLLSDFRFLWKYFKIEILEFINMLLTVVQQKKLNGTGLRLILVRECSDQ